MAERVCVFCGRTGRLSKQHVVGRQLTKLLPARPAERQYQMAREVWTVDHGIDRELKDVIDFESALTHVVRAPCAECNQGWMADCESLAKPLLDRLHKTRQTTLSRPDQLVLASWACLTSMTIELFDSPRRAQRPDFAFLRTHRHPPPDYSVWAGAHDGPEWTLGWRHASFTVDEFDSPQAGSAVKDGGVDDTSSAAIFFGQLVILVVRSSSQQYHLGLNPKHAGGAVTAIWPADTACEWPRSPLLGWPLEAHLLADSAHNAFIHMRRVTQLGVSV